MLHTIDDEPQGIPLRRLGWHEAIGSAPSAWTVSDFLHQAIDRSLDKLAGAARTPICHSIEGHHQRIERLSIRGYDLKRQISTLSNPGTANGLAQMLEGETSRWLQDAHVACEQISKRNRERTLISEIAKILIVLVMLGLVCAVGYWIFVVDATHLPMRPDFAKASDFDTMKQKGLDGVARSVFLRTLLFALCGSLTYTVAIMLRQPLGPAFKKAFASIVLAVPVAMLLSLYRATSLFDAAQNYSRDTVISTLALLNRTVSDLPSKPPNPDLANASAELKTAGHAVISQVQGLTTSVANMLNSWMQASETVIYIVAFGVSAILPALLVRLYAMIEGTFAGAIRK